MVQSFDEPKKFDQNFIIFLVWTGCLIGRADENDILSQFYNNQNGNKSIKNSITCKKTVDQ